MTTSYDIPLPGESLDHGTVIASTWTDDSSDTPSALFIVLRTVPPFYSVIEATAASGGSWSIDRDSEHANINYAVTDYADSGGDV